MSVEKNGTDLVFIKRGEWLYIATRCPFCHKINLMEIKGILQESVTCKHYDNTFIDKTLIDIDIKKAIGCVSFKK